MGAGFALPQNHFAQDKITVFISGKEPLTKN